MRAPPQGLYGRSIYLWENGMVVAMICLHRECCGDVIQEPRHRIRASSSRTCNASEAQRRRRWRRAATRPANRLRQIVPVNRFAFRCRHLHKMCTITSRAKRSRRCSGRNSAIPPGPDDMLTVVLHCRNSRAVLRHVLDYSFRVHRPYPSFDLEAIHRKYRRPALRLLLDLPRDRASSSVWNAVAALSAAECVMTLEIT